MEPGNWWEAVVVGFVERVKRIRPDDIQLMRLVF
jgi:hypothetical protein